MRQAIIWRKSIYDNNFVCKCGKKLMTNYDIENDVLFSTTTNELICPNCYTIVGIVTTEDEAVKSGAFRGETD